MSSYKRDLVFIGGGHAHALVLREFGVSPVADTRITLVSEQPLTPYSGMLPGFVAGHYSYLDTHIDLRQLCSWAKVRFIEGRVTGIDANTDTILMGSESLQYDQLSIDIGSTPDLSVPGAREYAVGVKPVSHFGDTWNTLLEASENTVQGEWGVVGAGAGGVELVLAMAHRLKEHKELRFHLAFSSDRVLPGYPEKVVKTVEQALAESNVTLHPAFRVASVQKDGLLSTDGSKIALDKSIWCTGAAAADWLAETGLKVSRRGFIEVNEFLQSTSHANVFASGDCADMLKDPRPKAGVYAVRQAPYLAHNLRTVCGTVTQELKPLNLQTDFLSLLSLGAKIAVGCRSGITLSGKWVWKLKNHIDQKFMRLLKGP